MVVPQTVGLAGFLLQTLPVPSFSLTLAAVILISLLAAVALVTVGYSVWAARRQRRRTEIRADLRGALLDRLYGRDEPAWGEWTAALSATERDELESLLDVYLRELDGRDAARLAGLGAALGIDKRARRDIAVGGYWERIHALVWLALLRDAPDRELLETHCTETPRERAAAARVLYAADAPDLATTGVDLLLRDDPSSFSVFGIDTLYRVGEADPGPLFERAAADFDAWEPALQQQVLLVARHLHTVIGGADLSWVVGALSSPEPRVRAAAWRALDAYGWNRGVRADIDPEAIADEPDPTVRASAYRMLGAWGDADAITTLSAAAESEPDGRTRVTAVGALLPHRHPDRSFAEFAPASDVSIPGDSLPSSLISADADAESDPLITAWEWASEHARFDRMALHISAGKSRN